LRVLGVFPRVPKQILDLGYKFIVCCLCVFAPVPFTRCFMYSSCVFALVVVPNTCRHNQFRESIELTKLFLSRLFLTTSPALFTCAFVHVDSRWKNGLCRKFTKVNVSQLPAQNQEASGVTEYFDRAVDSNVFVFEPTASFSAVVPSAWSC